MKVFGTFRNQPFSLYVTLDPAARSPVQQYALTVAPGMQLEATEVIVNLQRPADDSVFKVECNLF